MVVNSKNTLRLLSLPILWMGIVQLVFGLLSLLVFQDGIAETFLSLCLLMISCSLLLTLTLRKTNLKEVSFRDALMFATLTWFLTGVLGSLPIMHVTQVSFTDAVFESLSALTTTGATILTGLDAMPPSFLMYRQFLQWMGGLGVVIFVVAVLPMLNVGGMRLLKAETPGPIKNEKLSPRIASTAHYLWIIYLLITVLCAFAYYCAGMNSFDAIAHSFSTVSTGGFSTHDASLGFFNNKLLLWISNIFMLLGAVSFALHYKVINIYSPRLYWRDEETRWFLLLVLSLSLILSCYIYQQHTYQSFADALTFATFSVISFITSTGFGAADLSAWPHATAMFLVFCGYLGGCAGSTAGGNKIIRNVITFKVMRNEMRQMVHPHAVLTLRYQKGAVDDEVKNAVMAFMSIAAASTLIMTLILMATGLDFWSSFTAVAACINVLGPGFDQVGSNFIPVSDVGTWVLSFTMILGRLEYFTVLALFVPAFWRY
ncbi:TrkH family potassium uptake protein [Paraglaciecola sp.]|uniref:TrkH family potassium uptake protein n=1 Tax=Paraglaciecola sp. TaxID=1920173 RepID=UPI0030F3B844